MDEKFVAKELCDERYGNIMARLDQIWQAVNPALVETKQRLDNHLQSHKESWSKSQLAIVAVVALFNVGSWVLLLISVLRR